MISIKVNEKIRSNKVVQKLWTIKGLIDVCNVQIGWVTGKCMDTMAVLYLLEKFGLVITPKQIIVYGFIIMLIMIGGGYMLKRTGLFDSQQEATASLNVVQQEIYEAAKKINKRFK